MAKEDWNDIVRVAGSNLFGPDIKKYTWRIRRRLIDQTQRHAKMKKRTKVPHLKRQRQVGDDSRKTHLLGGVPEFD
ncbi:MAG: hypothetical protein AB1483_12860 [Candidatus Zixiibacteriota bacterium]